MRCRKSFVQVQVNDINAHVAGARNPYERVHVRAVHVNQPACVVDDLTNLFDAALKQTDRIRVRQHQARHIARRAQLAQVI